ncbi:hypothetical protein ICN46_11250, partial [Polynucleobacter sp. Latsch14-2]|uniref:hypothetical protein n=1 Tax=Polynucleobacter sp. Latsch14-2 TaxID=2576920 RepID=UPI001C0CAB78
MCDSVLGTRIEVNSVNISGGPVNVASGHFLTNLKLAQAIIAGNGQVNVHVNAQDLHDHIHDLELNLGKLSAVTFDDSATPVQLSIAQIEQGADVLKLIGGDHGSIYNLHVVSDAALTAQDVIALANNSAVDLGILSNISHIEILDSAAGISAALDSLGVNVVNHLLSPTALSITLSGGDSTILIGSSLNDADQLASDIEVLKDIQSPFKLSVNVAQAPIIADALNGNTHFTGLNVHAVLNNSVDEISTLTNWISSHSEILGLLSAGGGITIGNGFGSSIEISSVAQMNELESLKVILGDSSLVHMGAITVDAGVPLSTQQLADLNTWSTNQVTVTLTAIDGYVSGAQVVEVDASGHVIHTYTDATDASGHLHVTASGDAGNQIVIIGGTDTFTNQHLTGELIAPLGYQVSTPLTTLLALAHGHVSDTDITSALGLSGVNLANFDPVAAMMVPGSATQGLAVFTAQQGIFTILQAVSQAGIASGNEAVALSKAAVAISDAIANATAISNVSELTAQLAKITDTAVTSIGSEFNLDGDAAKAIATMIKSINANVVDNYKNLADALQGLPDLRTAQNTLAIAEVTAGITQTSLLGSIAAAVADPVSAIAISAQFTQTVTTDLADIKALTDDYVIDNHTIYLDSAGYQELLLDKLENGHHPDLSISAQQLADLGIRAIDTGGALIQINPTQAAAFAKAGLYFTANTHVAVVPDIGNNWDTAEKIDHLNALHIQNIDISVDSGSTQLHDLASLSTEIAKGDLHQVTLHVSDAGIGAASADLASLATNPTLSSDLETLRSISDRLGSLTVSTIEVDSARVAGVVSISDGTAQALEVNGLRFADDDSITVDASDSNSLTKRLAISLKGLENLNVAAVSVGAGGVQVDAVNGTQSASLDSLSVNAIPVFNNVSGLADVQVTLELTQAQIAAIGSVNNNLTTDAQTLALHGIDDLQIDISAANLDLSNAEVVNEINQELQTINLVSTSEHKISGSVHINEAQLTQLHHVDGVIGSVELSNASHITLDTGHSTHLSTSLKDLESLNIAAVSVAGGGLTVDLGSADFNGLVGGL